ncbi:hypothetical protein PGTUg99_020406 [Puccinia graminis f. sp. tritici]|uniref:Uncharacterized protein n=1 Tax=Puccinia graminis f. sp. tritici TaxID=56615 RepID=A0A5B0M8C3_PUCGR|nr:hypothetical protein PGTUg99_020406 [Puccinia graminis f. sp. tritici]
MYFGKIDSFQTERAKLSEAKLVASMPIVSGLGKSGWIDAPIQIIQSQRRETGRSSIYGLFLGFKETR